MVLLANIVPIDTKQVDYTTAIYLYRLRRVTWWWLLKLPAPDWTHCYDCADSQSCWCDFGVRCLEKECPRNLESQFLWICGPLVAASVEWLTLPRWSIHWCNTLSLPCPFGWEKTNFMKWKQNEFFSLLLLFRNRWSNLNTLYIYWLFDTFNFKINRKCKHYMILYGHFKRVAKNTPLVLACLYTSNVY